MSLREANNSVAMVDAGLVFDTDAFVKAQKDVIDSNYMGGPYKDHLWQGFVEEINAFGCVYNRDLVDQLGLSEFPTTWDALLAAGKELQGRGIALTTLRAYWPVLFGFVQQATPEGKQAMIDGDWNSPTWLASMESFAQLIPFLSKDELELTDATAALRVRDGQMLFYPDGQWMIGNVGLDPVDAAGKLGVAPFPAPAGPTIAGWTAPAIGITVAMSDSPERVDAAWRFLEFWATDEDVAKSFIADLQSPMGVRTDLITADLAGPFLPQFIAAVAAADLVYEEAGVWVASDTWGAVQPGFDALTLGQSPQQALDVMMGILRAG